MCKHYRIQGLRNFYLAFIIYKIINNNRSYLWSSKKLKWETPIKILDAGKYIMDILF